MGMSVLAEIGSLMWSHPYVSCSLLVFLTPPFFPILKYFSPLLISTALFVVALVTMGPHFEEPSEEDGDFLRSSDVKAGEEAAFRREDTERDAKTMKSSKGIRTTWSDWVKSCKESGISWIEKKLQNENWKGGSLNDENVSILQEAFAHRAEVKPQVMSKLVTRRIPDEEERAVEEAPLERHQDIIPGLSHSDSWASDRSFERPPPFSTGSNTRDLPHNFFSPHPSFSRRHDTDNPLFENVIPPPIDYDMPPLITGPASITAPLFKSLEDDMDSDDEYDHHHCDHEHLEVGERSLDAELFSHDELPVANGTHHQPVENLASSGDEGHSASAEMHQENGATADLSLPSMHDEVHHHDLDVTGAHEESAPPANDAPEGHLTSADTLHEERSIPATEIHHESHHGESSQPNEELHDIPELEDVLPVENELPAPVLENSASLPDVPATSEVPTDHTIEVLADSNDSEVPPHFVERSMSLPVVGSIADAGSLESAPAHEDLPPLDRSLPEAPAHATAALNHAISLPAALNPIRPIILPPKTTEQGPLSPDTDLGTATTFDHEKRGNSITSISGDELEHAQPDGKHLSTKDKLLNIEVLCNSIPPTPAAGDTKSRPLQVPKALKATTEEQVTQVVEKITSFVEDSPSKKFQPDAPQLQITPPSTKVVLTSSPTKSAVGRASIRPPASASRTFSSRYSSSDDESGDEEIDLDSDVEVEGDDSDSDFDDLPLPVKSGTKLKAPPKPPSEIRPAPTVVQA